MFDILAKKAVQETCSKDLDMIAQPPQSTGPVSEQPQLQVIKMHKGKRDVVNRLFEAALFPKRAHSKLINLTHIFQE